MAHKKHRDRRDPEGFCIYRHVCRVTGKSYIGLTGYGPERRWSQHRQSANLGAPTIFHRAIRKHGADAFDLEVLERVATRDAANTAEARWIAHFKSNHLGVGYNIDAGGNTSERRNDTKAKIGAAQVRRWALMTPEAKSQAGHRLNSCATPSQRRAAFFRNWDAITPQAQNRQVMRLRGARTAEQRSIATRLMRANETTEQRQDREARRQASLTAEQRSAAASKRAVTLGSDGLKNVALKIAATWASMSAEEQRAIIARRQIGTSPESRRAAALKAAAVQTPEARSARARKMNAAFTPEERSEIARKREAIKRERRATKGNLCE